MGEGDFMGELGMSGVESQKLNTARGNIAFNSVSRLPRRSVGFVLGVYFFFERSDRVPGPVESHVCSPSRRCADDSAPSLMYSFPSHHCV
jgi:hypothetical protein